MRISGILLIIINLFAAGCATKLVFDGTFTIKPPVEINATVCGHSPHSVETRLDVESDRTIGLLVRVNFVEEFLTTYRTEGTARQKTHWYVVTCSVLRVDYGRWTDNKLVFLASRGGGGTSDYIPFQFLKGRFLFLGLRETEGLPEITYCDRRGYFATHDRIEESNYYLNKDPKEQARRIRMIRESCGIVAEDEYFFSADREFESFVTVETISGDDYQNVRLHLLDAKTLEPIPFQLNNRGEIVIITIEKKAVERDQAPLRDRRNK